MDITTKSAIGLVAAGATATVGYFGWKALSSNVPITQADWEAQNEDWFNRKYTVFDTKVKDSANNRELSEQWSQLQKDFVEGKGISAYELARKLQDWCKSSNNDSKFAKIREECANLA